MIGSRSRRGAFLAAALLAWVPALSGGGSPESGAPPGRPAGGAGLAAQAAPRPTPLPADTGLAAPDTVRWVLEELIARAGPGEPGVAGHAVDRIRFDREAPGVTLAERLARLPGVEVWRRGAGGPEVVSLRGSRPEAVLVLLDGVPLNDPVTGLADLSAVPASTLASAVVVRGGVAAGAAGALSGAILLRTRDAEDGAARVRVETGSFGRRAAEAAGGVSGPAGSLSTLVRYEASRNDYRYENRTLPGRPEERRRNADHRAWHATLSARSRTWPLAARVRLDRLERGAPGRMSSRVFDRARWEERALHVSLEAGEADGPRARLGIRDGEQRYRDPRRAVREATATSELRWVAELPVGGIARLSGHAARQTARGSVLEDAERWAFGLRASAALPMGPARLTPGLSLDAAAGARAASPSLALEWPLRSGRVWARAGRALRLPALGDLHVAPDARVRPAAELDPERVELDAEVGAALRSAGGAFQGRATAWFRRTRDPIVWLPSASAVWSPRNVGHLVAHGVEADGEWSPAPGWGVEAALTWNRSRVGFGSNRNPLPHVPTWRGRLAVEHRGSPLFLRAELEASSARHTSLAGTHSVSGFALVHVSGRRAFEVAGLPVAADVRLRNLLDAEYERLPLFPEPGRSVEVGLTVGPIG